ncbi:MAG: 3D domain-containing protein [Candidatus Eisenbacteria bacterium]|nr:3D domain-containing protein [Candidatus Eisenbacteria bacterium]
MRIWLKIQKMGNRRGTGTLLACLLAPLVFASADAPSPRTGGEPVKTTCFDSPDAGDYVLGRERRFTLLPPLDVIVTGYSSTPDQTDSTPYLTASMTSVRPGVIALSRDLIRTYNPSAPFDFGDRVILEGIGEFVVEDTMNKRYRRRADIWFSSTDEARRWGKKVVSLSPAREKRIADISGSVAREASAL